MPGTETDEASREADPATVDPREHPAYREFFTEVRRAQLQHWLPLEPSWLLDVSHDNGATARVAAAAGHQVVSASSVHTDPGSLSWVRDASVDGVVAEDRALSLALYTELVLADIARVLRPGGRLLLSVESTVAGLAQLARNGRWPELADAPSADVVLVPYDDGVIRRCFWPEELYAALSDAGLVVDWIRPRTVLSPAAVVPALSSEPARLPDLVRMEIRLATERTGEAAGSHLLAAARRPEG